MPFCGSSATRDGVYSIALSKTQRASRQDVIDIQLLLVSMQLPRNVF
jgi:hypothetical protein